jgi:hypothetical protein
LPTRAILRQIILSTAKGRKSLVDINDLAAVLDRLEPGKYASIHHSFYADLFPPGEPSEDARAACHKFARAAGCRIENQSAMKEIWFVKDSRRA